MANGNDSDRDEYVLVTHSDSDQNQTPGEEPEVIAQIKAWLSPTDFDSDTSEFKKHLNAHVSGTGQWILATDQYRRWHDTDEIGDIWLRGIPGSGKSVVAASLVRELQRNGHIVLFFFFRHIIMSNRSPQSLMRDCLSQLLDHCPSLQSSLKQVMAAHREIAEVPIDELWKCFSSAFSAMEEVYCVFDALDEMEMGQEKFLQDLVNLGRRYPKSIKLALTSRQLPYLEAHLQGSCLVDLRLDRKNVDRDIAIYISHRLKSADLGEHEADQIKEAIGERGKGLFLYARLMMDQCLQSPAKFMLDLDTLPDGLGDMYTDLLQQHAIISGTTQEFQILILSWITHSLRPLRLLELATIIDFFPDRGGLKEHQDAKLAIRSACGPLLEVCEDEVVQIIHHSFTEYLLNMDVTHIQMADEQAQRFPVLDPHHIHTMISQTCIQYLRSGCFNDWTPGDSHFYSPKVPKGLLLRFPFLQYAARYFILHAGKVANVDSNLWGDLDALLQTESHDFGSWKEFWEQGSPQTYENAATSDKVSMLPLHVAAYGGFATYIEYLLAKGADRDSRDGTGKTPLMFAAMEGHSEVVRVLLKSNACHDCVDNSGWTAVHYAAKMNRADALEVLLTMGAEPLTLRIIPKIDRDRIFTPVEWDPETALTLVCRNGHKEALQVMIKHVDTSHLLSGLLHCAADRARAQILQVLLQNDEVRSHINTTDKNGNTPLYLASGARNVASVKILLQHGAVVTARSTGNLKNARKQLIKARIEEMSLGYTPLHGLAHLCNGSGRRNSDSGMTEFIEVLELLLQSGSDINERDGEGRTILFAWPEFRDFRSERAVDYVSILLQHGADASVIDKTGATPLHLFDRGWGKAVNNENVLKILVKAGADINAATIDGQTPLIASAKRQLMYPSSFDGLNVDFDRQDLEGNTALHYACNSACMEYEHAKEWLARCDPKIRNNAGRFAFTNFHWLNGGQGRVDAIALMVEKGLSLESRDYLGRTPLLHFLSSSGRGSVHFVEELLRLGADARAVDYQGKSTLHLLAAYNLSNEDHGVRDVANKVSLMQLLINAGASPQASDFTGNSVFHDAITCGEHWILVQCAINAVLAVGVKPYGLNHKGRNSLHLVSLLNDNGSKDALMPIASPLDYILQLEPGFNINASDYQGRTPFHLACAETNSGVNLCKLVKSGAKIAPRDILGRTPLHLAAEAGHANNVQLLVELYQKESIPLDGQDLRGRTALHEAVKSGRPESVKLLLDAGANPRVHDKRGRNALHAAAEFEETSAARVKQRRSDSDDPLRLEQRENYMRGEKRPDAFDKMNLVVTSEDENKDIREVVRLLLATGGLALGLDRNEHTPTEVAIMLGSASVVDEISRQLRTVYRQTPPGLGFQATLPSLDPLGEKIFTVHSEDIERTIANLQAEDSVSFLERVICSRNVALVEEFLRVKRPCLVGDDGTSILNLAARWGLVPIMKVLIPWVEDLDEISPPLLHTALKRLNPNLEMIKLLVGSRININRLHRTEDRVYQTDDITSALHILATGKYQWYPSALRLLLDAGADLEVKDHRCETPLYTAVSGGPKNASDQGEIHSRGFWCDDVLDLLLENGANANMLANDAAVTSTPSNLTPLNCALEAKRDSAIIGKLLNRGADGNFGPKPAIASAVDGLNYESLELLLKAGANPNVIYNKSTTDRSYQKVFKRRTPLICAASHETFQFVWDSRLRAEREDEEKRRKIITLLLAHGADPSQNIGSSTVLHKICSLNGFVQDIVRSGANLEMKDKLGRTPLLRSCEFGNRNSSRSNLASLEMIRGGADIHVVDNNGSTAVHYAVKSRMKETIDLLLEKGASAVSKDNAGLSPMNYAFYRDRSQGPYYSHNADPETIDALLGAGADPLEHGRDGQTALHYLAFSLMTASSVDKKDMTLYEYLGRNETPVDRFEIYSKLYNRFIDAGCDREARDNNGNTPLFMYVAAVKPYSDHTMNYPPDPKDVQQMFQEHDIHAVNNAGDTLLHVVARREKDEYGPNDTVELWKMLVELGLDPKKENKKNASPLDTAAAFGNEDILALYTRDE